MRNQQWSKNENVWGMSKQQRNKTKNVLTMSKQQWKKMKKSKQYDNNSETQTKTLKSM